LLGADVFRPRETAWAASPLVDLLIPGRKVGLTGEHNGRVLDYGERH